VIVKRVRLIERRKAVGLSQEKLAELLGVDRTTVVRWERADTEPQPWQRPRLAKALRVSAADLTLLLTERSDGQSQCLGDDLEALELERRINASDLSAETLNRLAVAKDELAMAYASTRPALLLPEIRRHLRYVSSLIDVKTTLRQRQRLLEMAGWLSLLAATVNVDLAHQNAMEAHLRTAESLAVGTSDRELLAWCLETRAWNRLTEGDHIGASRLAEQARQVAPPDGSAYIQATAQTGRAFALLGDRKATAVALTRVEGLAASLAVPDQPEHHFRYDPTKALAYVATTLSWVGDPAAEEAARTVLAELMVGQPARPRRVAAAQLDLGLALAANGELDEARDVTLTAVRSGRIVPSNYWRVARVAHVLDSHQVGDAQELRLFI
jgi:transcriptional regulator with XRE-family HTH domain